MAKVVAPITALVEVIGKPRESSYEVGSFYYPTLFIDLSQPEGSDARKIWKNLSDGEISQIKPGDHVQLIPAGKDKTGRNKHNIVLLPQEIEPMFDADVTQSSRCWTLEQKKSIASCVQQHSDLLRYCLETAKTKFDGLVQSEESLRCLATTLYLTAIKNDRR